MSKNKNIRIKNTVYKIENIARHINEIGKVIGSEAQVERSV